MLVLADPLFPDWVLQIIIASVGATISGIILLLIHHRRVKQEIEIHRENELFDRKQESYRWLMKDVFDDMDYANYLGNEPNWKIGRHIYNELLLIGSQSVINAYDDYLTNYNKVKEPEKSELIKKILTEIRKDLYPKELGAKKIRFIVPPPDTAEILKLIGKHRTKLEEARLFIFKNLSTMDIDDAFQKTNIDKQDLEKMKKIAQLSMDVDNKFEEVLGRYTHKN